MSIELLTRQELAVIPGYKAPELSPEDQYWLDNPDWHDHFSRFYYDEYYRPEPNGEIPADEQFTLSNFAAVLRNANLPTDRQLNALVIGPGVTLDDAALLVPYASSITLGEYSSGNRDQLLKWWKNDPGANDWDPYFKYILEYEGKKATPEAIAERGSLLRNKITDIVPFDAMQSDPLGQEGKGRFDIIIAPYCYESASSTVEQYRKMESNGSSTGKPGALILEAGLSDCSYYFVGGRPYPGARVNRTHVDAAFRSRNMTDTSISEGHFPEHGPLGYDKVFVASGRLPIQEKQAQVPFRLPFSTRI